MDFIIHAAGSLGNRADLGKHPYRLHCRFRVGADASKRDVEQAANIAADTFIADMAVQGWQHLSQYGFRLTFKGSSVVPMNLGRPKRPPSSREMLPQVMQGATFRSTGEPAVMNVLPPSMVEFVDFDLSGVFLHNTILSEIPDLHEERRH